MLIPGRNFVADESFMGHECVLRCKRYEKVESSVSSLIKSVVLNIV